MGSMSCVATDVLCPQLPGIVAVPAPQALAQGPDRGRETCKQAGHARLTACHIVIQLIGEDFSFFTEGTEHLFTTVHQLAQVGCRLRRIGRSRGSFCSPSVAMTSTWPKQCL